MIKTASTLSVHCTIILTQTFSKSGMKRGQATCSYIKMLLSFKSNQIFYLGSAVTTFLFSLSYILLQDLVLCVQSPAKCIVGTKVCDIWNPSRTLSICFKFKLISKFNFYEGFFQKNSLSFYFLTFTRAETLVLCRGKLSWWYPLLPAFPPSACP